MSTFSLLVFGIGVIVAAVALVAIVRFILKKPTGKKDWSLDQAILPWAEIGISENGSQKVGSPENSSVITIHNIRNFTYRTRDDYTPAYYDKTFRLANIVSLDFVVEPFSGHRGAAHTLVTFGLRDANASQSGASPTATSYIAISIEIRKQKSETFSAVRGLFKQFELMYVVADERDVIGLRANIRRDEVYLYPVKASPAKIRAFFLEILHEVNRLKEKPEFYNTITNTCSTNLARHANAVSPHRIPWSMKILVPAYSDRLLYDIGLLDTSIPFEALKEKCHINARAAAAKDDPEFSAKIRR